MRAGTHGRSLVTLLFARVSCYNGILRGFIRAQKQNKMNEKTFIRPSASAGVRRSGQRPKQGGRLRVLTRPLRTITRVTCGDDDLTFWATLFEHL